MGFDASDGANMTVTKIEFFELDYTVNAATNTTSTTRIHVGKRGKPINVTGESAWSYDVNTKILSVDAEHNSPAYIVIEWQAEDIDIVQDYINRTYPPIVDMMGVVLVVMAAVLIFCGMNNIPVDTKMILDMLLVAIILGLGAYVLTYFTF